MASNYWIKLYHEILDDPKMGRLPDRLWRRTIELFLLAGDLGQPDGQLPPVGDMAWRLRITDEDLREDLQQLQSIGVVHEEPSGSWIVTNFSSRQAALSSTERTRLQRKRDRQQGNEWIPELVSQVPDQAGVYAIRCKATNKLYIGASTNMKRRVSDHLREITQTAHHAISEDFQKHGQGSLEVLVIERVEAHGHLKEREGHWLGQYAPSLLYNRETRSKPHRDWVRTEAGRGRDDYGTKRPIDIDTDSEKDSDTDLQKENPPPTRRRRAKKARQEEQVHSKNGLSLDVSGALKETGVFPELWQEVARSGRSDPEIMALLAWSKDSGSETPGALFMSRLRNGASPPAKYLQEPCPSCGQQGDHHPACSSRYTSGHLAQHIEH